MKNWGIDRAWQTDPNALWDAKVRGRVMTQQCPPQFSLSEREQAICVCVCSSLRFVHVDLQTQTVAALKDKEEKCVRVCVCVSLSHWEPHSMTWHILHGAQSKLVVSVWHGNRRSSLASVMTIQEIFSHTYFSFASCHFHRPSSHLIHVVWTMFLYPQCRYNVMEI